MVKRMIWGAGNWAGGRGSAMDVSVLAVAAGEESKGTLQLTKDARGMALLFFSKEPRGFGLRRGTAWGLV